MVPPTSIGERADRHALAGADLHAGSLQRAERRHRDFDGVGVGPQVREHEIAGRVGDDRESTLVFCDSLINVTVAPGTTPPCSSLTVPVMVPVVICADAIAASAEHAERSEEPPLQSSLQCHTVPSAFVFWPVCGHVKRYRGDPCPAPARCRRQNIWMFLLPFSFFLFFSFSLTQSLPTAIFTTDDSHTDRSGCPRCRRVRAPRRAEPAAGCALRRPHDRRRRQRDRRLRRRQQRRPARHRVERRLVRGAGVDEAHDPRHQLERPVPRQLQRPADRRRRRRLHRRRPVRLLREQHRLG